MEGANQPVDEAAEERKGGAGDLGKVGCAAAPQLGWPCKHRQGAHTGHPTHH